MSVCMCVCDLHFLQDAQELYYDPITNHVHTWVKCDIQLV